MASTSSNSTSKAYEYDVFLSFRGADTRLTFTDCLYHALVDDGVVVFRDSEGLHMGDKIEELLHKVSNSKIFLVVLSKGYASSVWCLREIERAVSLHESTGSPKILPVFLDVTPADVKLKTAIYADALNKHREKHGDDQVGRWKATLEIVAEISGLEGQGQAYTKLINYVVGEILPMVKKREIFVRDFVGIDERVNDVIKLLDIHSEGVRFVGIHGMAGVGKTTLAKVIFNKIHSYFTRYSFMDDVRESMNKKGLLDLQKKLVRDLHNTWYVDHISNINVGRNFIEGRKSSNKVLIVLDDIDENEQLESLVGAPDSFFGGSRVLITTRDKEILAGVRGIITYEVNHLDSCQALKLFCMQAFKSDSPPYTYLNLSKQVVSKAGGLPLTLSIIGSHLHEKNEEIWRETLDKLNKTLPNKVLDKLMISYNALEENEKCIFLDIACFFIGEKKTRAMDVWEACSFYPISAIEVLTNKSLIKINEDECIWMHDQLRDLGREIIFHESPKDATRRSRFWNHEEALAIVRLKKGKKMVEGLVLHECFNRPIIIKDEDLKSMPNLRFLQIKEGTFVGDFTHNISNLKCIYWHSPPPNCRLTNFYLKELVHLELLDSKDTEDWGGWNLLKEANKIKVLVLKRCTGLTKTPDLSGCLYLERLSFCECSNIQAIDSSIEKLKQLDSLFLGGCKKLQELPEFIGKLISLKHLDISNTKVTELPNSIRHLKRLKVLRMNHCWIKKLPETIGELESLEELHARNCEMLKGELHYEIGRLSSLRILCLSNTHICAVPSTINLLTHLEELDLDDCNRLQELPELPLSLNRLFVHSSSLQSISNLFNLTNLARLNLCIDSEIALVRTSNTAQSSLLQWLGKSSRLACDSSWFSNLKCLTNLELSRFPTDEIQLSGLEVLRHLTIEKCDILKRLSISSSLKMLEQLEVSECCLLEEIRLLGELQSLEIQHCPLLVEIQILRELESLEIQHCYSLKRLCDLSKLRKLYRLYIHSCTELQEIEIFSILEPLRDFCILKCNSLRRISSLSNCKNLNDVRILFCSWLRVVEGIDELEALHSLYVWNCGSLEEFIDLQSTKVKDDCSISISKCKKLLETSTSGWPPIPLASYREKVISSRKGEQEINVMGLMTTMESQGPHADLHRRVSPSSPLNPEVEMATRLQLGPPQWSCLRIEEIKERPLVYKNQQMMEDKDLKSMESVMEIDIELQLMLSQPSCLCPEEIERRSFVLHSQKEEEKSNSGEGFKTSEYQMRPSYSIDLLQDPQCHHGKGIGVSVPSTSNVREFTPPMPTMSSQGANTQPFVPPLSFGAKELLNRKRKSPFI